MQKETCFMYFTRMWQFLWLVLTTDFISVISPKILFTKPVDFETRKCKTPGSFLHMSALFTVILTSCLLSFLWSLKSCDCFYEVGTTIYCSAIFSVLSLYVVAPFRRYGDVMCVPSIPRLLKALLQLFEVVLKSTPCTEHRVHCSSKRKSSHESHVSCIESQCQCP